MDGETSSTPSMSSSSTGADPAMTTGTPTEATSEATTEGASGGTSGLDEECSPERQDCAEGLKCTAYSKRPMNNYDAHKCVLEPEKGGVAGEGCEVMGADLFAGIDTCAKGYICLNFDDDGKDGICLDFCQSDSTCMETAGGFCIGNGGNSTLPVCLLTCEPVLQDCPGALAGQPATGVPTHSPPPPI